MSRDHGGALSPADYAESERTHDTMDELMEKFKVTISPEVRFKFQKEFKDVKGSLNISTFPLFQGPDRPRPRASLVLKPAGDASSGWFHVRKVEVNSHEKALKVFSNKFRVGFVTAQFSAGHNFRTGRMGFAYNLKFMGPMGIPSDGSVKFQRKVFDQGSIRTKLFVDYTLPQIEGRMSNAEDERYTTTDVGSVSVDVNKVDLVWRFDKPRKLEGVPAAVQVQCPSCAGTGLVTEPALV